MLSILLPAPIVAVLSFTILAASLVAHFLVFIPLIVLKLIMPTAAARGVITEWLIAVAVNWVGSYHLLFRVLFPMDWDVEIDGDLDPTRSYMLISNHQSWMDIPVLFDVFHRRTPFPRFFLKRELAYVPIIGAACWAMEFPFMKRHTKDEIAHNPALADEDLEVTRMACERFKLRPATVVNFLEGTRFSEAKRRERGSPYRHLLRPKAGGMSFAMNAMGDQFAGVIDVTIVYEPRPRPPFLAFLRGEQTRIRVRAEVLPLPEGLVDGDYQADPAFRERFQNWINRLWARKDEQLDRLLAETEHGAETITPT